MVREKIFKKLMYMGFTGHDTPFELHGVKFEPRVVYNVDDEVYEFFRRVHKFVEVDSVKNNVQEFPRSHDRFLGMSGNSANIDVK